MFNKVIPICFLCVLLLMSSCKHEKLNKSDLLDIDSVKIKIWLYQEGPSGRYPSFDTTISDKEKIANLLYSVRRDRYSFSTCRRTGNLIFFSNDSIMLNAMYILHTKEIIFRKSPSEYYPCKMTNATYQILHELDPRTR